MPQSLTFPVETDDIWVINDLLCGWYLRGGQSDAKPGVRKAKGRKDLLICPSSTQSVIIKTLPPPKVILDSSVGEWLRFQALVAEWHRERGATSSITEMSMCPAYQSIIGMGERAVPFILSQLRSQGEEPDQWFWALQSITGTYTPYEHSGDYLKMAEWWLKWGSTEGYVGW
jgi:hypothetical protein